MWDPETDDQRQERLDFLDSILEDGISRMARNERNLQIIDSEGDSETVKQYGSTQYILSNLEPIIGYRAISTNRGRHDYKRTVSKQLYGRALDVILNNGRVDHQNTQTIWIPNSQSEYNPEASYLDGIVLNDSKKSRKDLSKAIQQYHGCLSENLLVSVTGETELELPTYFWVIQEMRQLLRESKDENGGITSAVIRDYGPVPAIVALSESGFSDYEIAKQLRKARSYARPMKYNNFEKIFPNVDIEEGEDQGPITAILNSIKSRGRQFNLSDEYFETIGDLINLVEHQTFSDGSENYFYLYSGNKRNGNGINYERIRTIKELETVKCKGTLDIIFTSKERSLRSNIDASITDRERKANTESDYDSLIRLNEVYKDNDFLKKLRTEIEYLGENQFKTDPHSIFPRRDRFDMVFDNNQPFIVVDPPITEK